MTFSYDISESHHSESNIINNEARTLDSTIEQRNIFKSSNNHEASCSYNIDETIVKKTNENVQSNVAKVIVKMKRKENIKTTDEERISECIKSSILRKKMKVHGKMRRSDIVEIYNRFIKDKNQR